MKKAFTLVELIIVVIIIGILLSVGMTIYSKTQEKGRAAEARTILGYIRTAEENYRLDQDKYTDVLGDLEVEGVTTDCSQTTKYFQYSIPSVSSTTFIISAVRCTSGGKFPSAKSGYSLTLDQDGVLSNPQGY